MESGPIVFLEAVSKGKLHLARFILGATDGNLQVLNAMDEEGETALIKAVRCIPETRTRTKMVELMVDHGAETNKQDKCGKTALFYACQLRANEVVKILIKRGVDPNVADLEGCTPLIVCCRVGNDIGTEIIVKCYRRLGLNIDHVDSDGLTALMTSLKQGYYECARILVHMGKASLEEINPATGLNPLQWALQNGCSQEEVDSVVQKSAAEELLAVRCHLNAMRTLSAADSDVSPPED